MVVMGGMVPAAKAMFCALGVPAQEGERQHTG